MEGILKDSSVHAEKVIRKDVNRVSDIVGATPKRLCKMRRDDEAGSLNEHYVKGITDSMKRYQSKRKEATTRLDPIVETVIVDKRAHGKLFNMGARSPACKLNTGSRMRDNFDYTSVM